MPKITDYERFVNQVAADTEVTKIVLTAIVAQFAIARGTGVIDDLEAISTQALQKVSPEAASDPETNRLHQLKLSRTDDYFRELRAIVAAAAPRPASARN